MVRLMGAPAENVVPHTIYFFLVKWVANMLVGLLNLGHSERRLLLVDYGVGVDQLIRHRFIIWLVFPFPVVSKVT
jgi:hypothetical protein